MKITRVAPDGYSRPRQGSRTAVLMLAGAFLGSVVLVGPSGIRVAMAGEPAAQNGGAPQMAVSRGQFVRVRGGVEVRQQKPGGVEDRRDARTYQQLYVGDEIHVSAGADAEAVWYGKRERWRLAPASRVAVTADGFRAVTGSAPRRVGRPLPQSVQRGRLPYERRFGPNPGGRIERNWQRGMVRLHPAGTLRTMPAALTLRWYGLPPLATTSAAPAGETGEGMLRVSVYAMRDRRTPVYETTLPATAREQVLPNGLVSAGRLYYLTLARCTQEKTDSGERLAWMEVATVPLSVLNGEQRAELADREREMAGLLLADEMRGAALPYRLRGQMYEEWGLFAEALADYRRAQAMDPDDAGTDEAIARVERYVVESPRENGTGIPAAGRYNGREER